MMALVLNAGMVLQDSATTTDATEVLKDIENVTIIDTVTSYPEGYLCPNGSEHVWSNPAEDAFTFPIRCIICDTIMVDWFDVFIDWAN